jgi:hypothetical protein
VETPHLERGDDLPSVLVTLHPNDVKRMQRVTGLLGSSEVAVMRHALELLDLISRHIDDGGTVRMVHPDGTNVTSLRLMIPGKGLQGVDDEVIPNDPRDGTQTFW